MYIYRFTLRSIKVDQIQNFEKQCTENRWTIIFKCETFVFKNDFDF